jgi:EAL domain-containing protein (putative c-di-GMP-specific phosphodiesterase class I)
LVGTSRIAKGRVGSESRPYLFRPFGAPAQESAEPLFNGSRLSAAKQGAAWGTVGLGLEIAVNISATDIEDLELPDRLADRCHRNGHDPSCIILELTETGAMREPMQMMDVLTRLRLKGFRLAIDDFGTGYSSLVQFQKLPFSEIKIDRTFTIQMMQNDGVPNHR